jgi:DNA-binding response OmpR family regulator
MNQNHVSQNHVHQHHINNNISVLMIEDEEDICEAVVSYLALEGFNVHGVSNTIQADNILAQQKVDIIVLDLGLPDKDGLEWL